MSNNLAMNAPPPTRRTRYTSAIVYLSILLLGAALGLGLRLKPEPSLTFDILIYKTVGPSTNFNDALALVNPSAERRAIIAVGADGTAVRDLHIYRTNIPQIRPVRISLSNHGPRSQIDIQGRERTNRTSVDLIYRANGKTSKHHFTLDTDQVRILELEKEPQFTYAVVRVRQQEQSPAKSAPSPNALATKGAQK